MPVNQISPIPTASPDQLIALLSNLTIFFKLGFGVLFVLYFIFALLVVRQVALMTDTLYTETSPILHVLAIIHAGIALGILILFIGLF